MSLVSLIIPCYRDAETLPRALLSVYRQTRPPDEVIVVNDCSPETDAIERALAAFPSVRYLRHDRNLGLAATRNTGIDAARGQILTFLDADDELHPQKIEMQVPFVDGNSAVTCTVQRVSTGELCPPAVKYRNGGQVHRVSSIWKMRFSNYLTGASLMIPKALMVSVGGYDASLRSCEDYDLWLRLLESGVTVHNLVWPLYIYHLNPAGLSRDHKTISYWELEVLRRHFSRIEKTGFEEGCVWAWWMIKHMVRAEVAHDADLKVCTRRHIEELSSVPILRWGLKVLDGSHVFRLCAVFK